jgi:hypothetical protein
MAASQEQVLKVRAMLDQLDHNTPEEMSNRRRAPRLPVRMSTTVTLLTSPAPTKVDVFTRNFSMSGFGFVSRRLFRNNERIVILIQFPGGQSKLILSRVTFGRYIRNGLYEMGTEFLECISNPKNPNSLPPHWSNSARAG